MEIGDPVVCYTHEVSDNASRTVDQLAFITGIVDDHTVDVVIFPPGGPVTFSRVSAFGDVTRPSGGFYFRAKGEAPPDFKAWDEYQVMLSRQRLELSQTPVPQHEELLLKQKAERDAALGQHEEHEPKRGVVA